MLDIELSGLYVEPSMSDIIRTSGHPESGVCTLASGRTLTAF